MKSSSTRRKRRGRRNRGQKSGSSTPSDSSKKKLSSSSRLHQRLGKNRQVREEWNEAVKVLAGTTWRSVGDDNNIREAAMYELTGKFGKTMEQFASIEMPSSTLESSECTHVTMRLLKTYNTLSLPSNDAATSAILSQSLMVFCAFVRNVCTEQQALFTADQLVTMVRFLLPHVASSLKHHAIDAVRTLSKVLLHNGDRCTSLYSDLVQSLSHQITSEQAFNLLLAVEGDKTLRDCAMDCLSSLCLGASNTTTSKTLLIKELKRGEFVVPLCIVIRSFVNKEDAEDVSTQSSGKGASTRGAGAVTSAWAALQDDDDEDDDENDEDDDGGDSGASTAWEKKSRTKHTAADIVTVTSTCRALIGLIAVLPSLGDSDRVSTRLITDLHRLSSFGVEDITASASSSVRRVVGSTTAPTLRSWRTSRSEKFSARKQWNDSDSESDSGVSSASDTEASDAEEAAPIGQLCARLRLQALGCLQRISTHHSTSVHQKWTELIAENEWEWEHLGRSSSYVTSSSGLSTPTSTSKATTRRARSLLATSIFDPSSKVRTTAASVVCMMVESAPLNQWIGGGSNKKNDKKNDKLMTSSATSPNRGKKRRPAFISMTKRISNTIVALHGGLFFALRRERMSSVVLHLLTCAQTLFLRLPYGAISDAARARLCQFVPELVRIVRTALRPALLNVAVATSALMTLGNAFSTIDAIPAVKILLMERKVDAVKAETKDETKVESEERNVAAMSTPPSTPPRGGKGGEGKFVPPHRRRGVNSGGMCSPVPVIYAPEVPPSSNDILLEIMSLCGGEGGEGGSGGGAPLFPDLPWLGLTVLAKISKRYPHAILDRWADVHITLLRSISSVEERLRVLGLNILTVLMQASASTSASQQNEKAQSDLISFVSQHLPRAFKDPKDKVRASVCGVLSNIHFSLWSRLNKDIRELFFREMLLTCSQAKSPKVQMAGCIGLGRLASVANFFTNPMHVQTAFKRLTTILESSTTEALGARAAWAFANLSDVAGPVEYPTRPVNECPLSLLRNSENGEKGDVSNMTIVKVTEVAIRAAMSPRTTGNGIKLCSSAIRALGSIGQYWLRDVGTLIVRSKGDAEMWMELSENDPSIDMATKVMETLSRCLQNTDDHEKLLWNTCHAVGRVLGAFGAYDVNDITMSEIVGGGSGTADVGEGNVDATRANKDGIIVTGVASAWIVGMAWYDEMLRLLATIVATCPNFKVRIHAVAALGRRCSGRKDYCSASLLQHVLQNCVLAYTTMDDVMDLNMDYRFRLKESLGSLIMRLTYMVDHKQSSRTENENENADLLGSLVENAEFLHSLIYERDRASGLSMISSDSTAMDDPSNASIIQEACAVQRQYHRLAAQLVSAHSSPVILSKKKQGTYIEKKNKAAWGDADSEDDIEQAATTVTTAATVTTATKEQAIPRSCSTLQMDSAAASILIKCKKRSEELVRLLGETSRHGKEEKSEQ